MVLVWAIVGEILAIVAAVLWFRASAIGSLPDWITEDRPQDATPDNLNFDLILGLTRAYTKSSAINRRAAIVTGLSVLCSAIATVLGSLKC